MPDETSTASTGGNGTAGESSAPAAVQAEGFADGLFGGPDPAPAPAAKTDGPAAATFDPNGVDWLRVDLSTVPDEFKPLQKVARNIQAQFTKEQQKLRDEHQKAMDTLRTQAPEPGARTDKPAADPYANLSPEERQALSVVDDRARTIAQELLASLGLSPELVNQLRNVAMEVQAPKVARDQAELDEAVNAGYDLDTLKDFGEQILALRKKTNPATQKPWTVREAYELLAGISHERSAKMADAEESARRDAKGRFVRPAAGIQADGAEGRSTRDAALASLSQLGFN